VIVMPHRYLEATYRQGKLLAAYLYLPRRSGDLSVRVEQRGPAFLIDWTEDGRPIGIEMPSPSLVTLEGFNRVLADLNIDPVAARGGRPGGCRLKGRKRGTPPCPSHLSSGVKP
jgi:hypothetical protein